jgi:hypothetical protein
MAGLDPATQPARVCALNKDSAKATESLGSRTFARWVAGSSPAMEKGGACADFKNASVIFDG